MFDISKAKREPTGKWDREEQQPRDMSYKSTMKAVLQRVRNLRLAIWTSIATLAFTLGWSAQTALGLNVAIAISCVLCGLSIYRVGSLLYWTKTAKQFQSASESSIKEISNDDKKPASAT